MWLRAGHWCFPFKSFHSQLKAQGCLLPPVNTKAVYHLKDHIWVCSIQGYWDVHGAEAVLRRIPGSHSPAGEAFLVRDALIDFLHGWVIGCAEPKRSLLRFVDNGLWFTEARNSRAPYFEKETEAWGLVRQKLGCVHSCNSASLRGTVLSLVFVRHTLGPFSPLAMLSFLMCLEKDFLKV